MITLTGRPISKKRSYQRSINGGMFLSKRYKLWQKDALAQLENYKEKYTGEVFIHYTFQGKGKYRFDLDNAVVSINDILQDGGVLINDNQIVSFEAHKLHGFKDWQTFIDIHDINDL